MATSPVGAAEDPPPPPPPVAPAADKPHTEKLRIGAAVPFINLFMTAGPFTASELKDYTPTADAAISGTEPAGLTNPVHATWTLFNPGAYPPVLGSGLKPAKDQRFILVSFGIETDQPGTRYLQMRTNYGLQLRSWQDGKLIYTQSTANFGSNGCGITLPKTGSQFTIEVEVDGNQNYLDLCLLDGTGKPSAANHSLVLSFPAAYTAEQIFAEGLIFIAPYPVLDANGAAEIKVWGCSPKIPLDKKFAIVMHQGETSLGRVDYPDCQALETRGAAISLKPPAVSGVMDIQLGVEVDGKPVLTRSVRLYSLTGLTRDLAAFDTELAALLAKNPGAVPNTRYYRQRIELILSRASTTPNGLRSSEAETITALYAKLRLFYAAEKEGRFPFAGVTGYSEQAYNAPQDNSVQPFLVYVPSSYDPEKQYPLVCYLHGYVPTYTPHNWIDYSQIPDFMAVMERNDCILVVPFGRSNTDFLQVGEADTLAAIAAMRSNYSVDPTRVYLYGYSMGGSGVYTLATHYPQLFAGGVVCSGRTDYYLWHQPSRDLTPRFKQVMISRDNPIEQPGNLVDFPMQIHHGLQDLAVSIKHTRAMQAQMDALKFTFDVHEYADASHWLGVEIMAKDDPVKFLLSHQRSGAMDSSVSIKTWTSQFGARNNFAILLTDDPTKPAELAAHWDNETLVITRFENIAALEVRNIPLPRREGFKLQLPEGLKLKTEWVNDKALMSRLLVQPKDSPYTLANLDDPTRLLKTPDTAGTVQDAFNGPFVITYGTLGDLENNKNKAQSWAAEWKDFAKGDANVLPDTAITDEIATNHNLVLVGDPESHTYWAKLADKLPITVKKSTVTVGDHTIKLDGHNGLLFIHPNPLHPRRYVVCNAGVRYGTALPINHKLDLVPDFILYADKNMVGGDDAPEPILAGFFTKVWRVDAKFIDSFEKK
ncbi:MAG TPA: prolyl oligopeptidase family serine peptidase [Planctomycetota bacterium]|nr:prolyl oligopeptidase family serine peptidase [Planctomycetota bacterium]